MQRKIEKRFDSLQVKTDRLLERLKGYSDEQLNQIPSTGGWSANQIVCHLMKLEEAVLKYMQKKLSFDKPIPKAGLKGVLRYWAMKAYNVVGIKIKAPAILAELPEQSDIGGLKERWMTERGALKQYMLSLPDETLKGELFKHPMVGKISGEYMVAFLEMHLERHRKQLERTLLSV